MYREGMSSGTIGYSGRLFTPGVVAIIALMIAGLLATMFGSGAVIEHLGISSNGIFHGKIWQLFTYPFVADPISLIFGGLMVLFLGSFIEREWRTRSFIVLWLVISIVSGMIWVLINKVLGSNYIGFGPAPCSFGFFALTALMQRGRRISILFATVDFRFLLIIFVVIQVLLNIRTPINLIWLSGAAVAYFYTKFRWATAANKSKSVSIARNRRTSGFVDID